MSELKISEILDKAADLIEPKGAWTQGESARDDQAVGLMADNPTACSFCMYGAIVRASGGYLEGNEVCSRAIRFLGVPSLINWNDRPNRTQAEVVAKLREAAQKAREQGL